jgi:hypothetical protein
MGKILCATRGGPAAAQAQNAAIALAKDQGSALLFLFVADADFLQRSISAVRPDVVEAELQSMGEFLLLVAQERAQMQGIEAEILVRSGPLRSELVATIRQENVTTVVLGKPAGEESIFELKGLRSLAASLEEETNVTVVIANDDGGGTDNIVAR